MKKNFKKKQERRSRQQMISDMAKNALIKKKKERAKLLREKHLEEMKKPAPQPSPRVKKNHLDKTKIPAEKNPDNDLTPKAFNELAGIE